MISAVALALARGLHTAGALCCLGTLFAACLGIAGTPRSFQRALRASVALVWLAAPFWLIRQTSEMAGTTGVGETLRVVPLALYGSGFGRALALRLLLLTLALWLGLRSHRAARLLALSAAIAACLLQIRMGHAAAPDAPWQAAAAGAHVLAAALWVGGLPSLLAALAGDAARAARRFSRLGIAAVIAITITAYVQCDALVGGLPGLLGTAYGRAVLLKVVLFVALLACAAANRFIFMPRLANGSARVRLRWSVRLEALIGLSTIGVAAWLSAQAPGAHEQPLWPFPWQPSLDALDDDALAAGVWRTIAVGAAGLLLGLGAICLPGLRTWRRLVALAGCAALIAGATPGLGALTAPATPTSFYESPTGFTRASVAAGAALYPRYCAGCHGPRGFGDGPDAADFRVRPQPLTGFHLLERSDGDMFWLLTTGLQDNDAGQIMPGFGDRLSEDARWALIDFVRTLAGAEPDGNAAPAHHHH